MSASPRSSRWGITVSSSPGAGSGAPLVEGTKLIKVYRGRTVLNVPEITLEAGKTYALLGASGAGKSTLLRVLGLLEPPTSGEVRFDGERLNPNVLSTRRRIAAVFQKPYLLRGTVFSNVEYGLKLRGVAPRERKRRVGEALDRVDMVGWESRGVTTLSGGEAQRVALARALVLEPELLLLDEPLSYLDPLLKRDLTVEFAEILTGTGLTAMYVTHDPDEAAVVADYMGVMRDGALVASGTPESVLTLPHNDWVAAFVGSQMPLQGTVLSREGAACTVACSGVEIRSNSTAPVGAEVYLGVRPESISIYANAEYAPRDPSLNRFECEVVDLRNTGTYALATVSIGELRLSVRVPTTSARALALTAGQRAVLSFPAEAAIVERKSR